MVSKYKKGEKVENQRAFSFILSILATRERMNFIGAISFLLGISTVLGEFTKSKMKSIFILLQ